eukprot:364159-Chlamydomonas_euryale.AAC.4
MVMTMMRKHAACADALVRPGVGIAVVWLCARKLLTAWRAPSNWLFKYQPECFSCSCWCDATSKGSSEVVFTCVVHMDVHPKELNGIFAPESRAGEYGQPNFIDIN